MTSQTFKTRVLTIAIIMMTSLSIQAQETDRNGQSTMQALIGQSLAKVQDANPEALLNCIAEMKRIDAMFPDSIQPKYVMALQSLNFAVMNPHAEQTEHAMAEAEQAISQMEKMKGADPSDICTLRGFLLMVRIVQDPAKNGQRYYLDVMDNYEKALKLNPDNQLAKQLQEKFFEGMKGGD